MGIDGISRGSAISNQQISQGQKNSRTREARLEVTTDRPIQGIETKQRRVSEDEIIKVIESANKEFKIYDRKLEFSIHEETKQIMVKIVDTSTEEVIKEIPSEKILDMVAQMMEMAGILVDEKV